MVYKVSEITLD